MCRRLYFIFVVLAFLPFSADAEEVRHIVTAGPCWETFTNRDGSGLYHEIMRAVFDQYGITIRHEYVPTDRGDELVRLGQADVMTCDDRAAAPLVSGRYPMFVNDFYVFFSKKRIGPWKGVETLRGKEVACQLAYYHDWDFPVPVRIRDMPSGVKCLEMVLLGRTDFYADDMSFINTSIRESGLSFDKDAYDTQVAGTRSYHPLFNQSPRGKHLRRLYEEGIFALHKAGKLKAIYTKWGHSYPDFDNF